MTTEVTNKILTLPNIITFARLLMVPLFVISLMVYENNIVAFVLFLVAASTDFLDGAIARSTHQVSKLGQQLDPLVDRILILAAVFVVFLVGRVPFWVLLVLLGRDICMLVLVAQLRATGQPELKVAFVGKIATALNMAGFCMLILYWPVVDGLGIIESDLLPGWGSSTAPLGIWFVYAGLCFAWGAGIFYMLRAYVNYRNSQRNTPGGTGSPNNTAAQQQSYRGADAYRDERGSTAQHHVVENPRGAQSGGRKTMTAQRPPGNNPTSANPVKGRPLGNKNQHNKSKAQTQPLSSSLLGMLNTPKKVIVAIAIFLLILLTVGFYSFDTASNFGVIHSGVRVGSVEVGQMEESEAATLIATEYNALANSAPIVLFANEEAAEAGSTNATVQLGNGVHAYNEAEVDPEATSWSATLTTFDAEVNGSSLAKEAYAVGRNADFLLGRLAASTIGVVVTPKVEFSADRLNGVEAMLTQSLGNFMVNASVTFNGNKFLAHDGEDGLVVESERFEQLLQQAFLTEDREFVVPLVESKMQVTLEDAEEVAESTQLAISKPVKISYGEAVWTMNTQQLGRVISLDVEEGQGASWQLVPHVDASLLGAVLPEIIGVLEDQIAPLNAEFVVVDGELQIVPSQNGTGVDYERLATDLEYLLFGQQEEAAEEDTTNEAVDREARTVSLFIGVLEPTIQTSDAEGFGFTNKVSEYTIEYPWVSAGTITNIHVASDLINSTIIAPYSIWSFNETAGNCTAEKGFVEAQVILGDEYVDEIGGGVCNVASTVFNAAYEGGYPIIERINHSLRLTRYPLGRDAAIAYPYADLKFENDTANYLLLTMTYTDWSVTCTLWGVSPGYTVESVTGELVEGADYITKEVLDETMAAGSSYVEQEGKKASKVEVTRTVYYADGSVKETRTFYSSYDATPEIVKKGPDLPKEE